MGRLRALLPLALGLVLALVASSLIYKWVQRKTATPIPLVSEEKTNIGLAKTDLQWGTKLTPEMITIAQIPKKHLPQGYFSDPKSLVDRVVISPLKQNEPILESKLAPSDVKTGGVSAVVKAGMRAIAVKGDKVLGLAGFIQPGNRVDVLLTINDKEGGYGQVTKIVLEDVLVLATGTMLGKGEGNKPAPVDVFTLEVTPEEGETLSLAASRGKLHFALRNVLDKEIVYTIGATISDTLDAYRPRLQPVSDEIVNPDIKAKVPIKKTSITVKTIKGNRVGEVSF